MLSVVVLVTWLCIFWAVVALAFQVVVVERNRPREFSGRAGRSARGVFYNFTAAMVPARKESARQHPAAFVTGLALHAGAILALAAILVLLFREEVGLRLLFLLRPVFAVSFMAGLVLFSRRLRSANLRAMSAPEDYIATLVTCGLLGLAFLTGAGFTSPFPLLIYAAALFLYLPLGKLKHAVFFFAARVDYGARLGYRGVYPPARVNPEKTDA